jgi:hypothetical protein
MENLKNLLVVEIKIEETIEVTGGSFGYDVGWAIYWGVQMTGINWSANSMLAMAAYDAHYK